MFFLEMIDDHVIPEALEVALGALEPVVIEMARIVPLQVFFAIEEFLVVLNFRAK